MPLITNPQLKGMIAARRVKTRMTLGDVLGYFAAAAFLGLTMGMAALGAVYPDLSTAMADPFVCDGELIRESARFAYDRPGQHSVYHDFNCVDAEGRSESVLGSVMLVSALVWTAILFTLFVLNGLVAKWRNALLQRGRRQSAERVRFSAWFMMALLGGIGATACLLKALETTPSNKGLVLAGVASAWWSLIFLRMIARRTVFSRISSPALMVIRAFLNLPFGLGAALGLSFGALWYGLYADDVNHVGSIVLGAMAGLAGLYPAYRTVRFSLDPKAYVSWLEEAKRRREAQVEAVVSGKYSPPEGDSRARHSAATVGLLQNVGIQRASYSEQQESMGQRLAQIAQAAELHAQGALSDEEFALLKAQLLKSRG